MFPLFSLYSLVFCVFHMEHWVMPEQQDLFGFVEPPVKPEESGDSEELRLARVSELAQGFGSG